MSRIDDVVSRIMGVAAEPRPPFDVKDFVSEGNAPPGEYFDGRGNTSRVDNAFARTGTSESQQAFVVFAEYWLHVLRRRWMVMCTVWVVVMLVACVVLWALPRRFESSAKFLVKNARQELLIGPNDRATTVYRDDVSEEIMNSELELLRSPDILGKVTRNLQLDAVYLERGKEPKVAAELAVRDLGRGLATETLRKTNVIRIGYRSKDPELAAAVVQQVADGYLASHLTVHSSPGTYELFRAQSEDASHELREAEEALAALARSANLVIPERQKQDALGLVSAADGQYKAMTADLQAQLARVRAAQAKMAEVAPRISTVTRHMPSQYSIEHLNTLIVELQNKRTDLLTKFKPDDRLVVQVDQQIADTAAAMGKARDLSADEESTDVNPTWQALETESMNAQLALAGLTGKAAELRRQHAEYQSRALELAEAGPRYEALVRKVAEARSKYELYVKKEEEARIAGALDTQQISNVVLAQAPYVSHVASEPSLRFGLMVGGIAATLLAFGAAFVADHLLVIYSLVWPRRVRGEAGSIIGAHS
jgi:succinoglycan biosynthesis transport protein ExoP